jgi:hypothetical protein
MSETLNWNLAVNVAGGPQLSSAATLAVDAYDKLEITLAKDAKAQTVKLGPGDWKSVSLVLMKPSQADAKLTYTVGSTETPLDGTHMLIGAGAVSLLGTGAAQLNFTNGTGNPVTLEILVGRTSS